MFLFLLLIAGVGEVGVEAGRAKVSCSGSTVTLKATPVNPPANYLLEWEDGISPGAFLVVNPMETTQYRVYLTDLDTNMIYEDVTQILVHPGDPDVFPDGELDGLDWLEFYSQWQVTAADPDFDPDGDGEVTILDFFYFCNFEVDPPNTPPSLMVENALTYRDETVTVNFQMSDNEQMPQLQIDVAPENGTAFLLGGELFYSPNEGFTGVDHFEVNASDGFIATLNETISVDVLVPDDWDDIYNNIFLVHCKACHIDAVSGGLSLATYGAAQMGGISGLAGFIAGNPDQSNIYLRVANNTMPIMADPLSQFNKERIRLWILRGAAP